MAQQATAENAGAVRPRAFTLELVKGCNLRCQYCYYADRADAYSPSTRMSQEVAERSVDHLLGAAAEGESVHVHFFGGEPLLNFPLLRHTVEYGEEVARGAGKGITFEVTTNGTALTDEVVRFLNAHHVQVGVSFDGPPDIQDVARPAQNGSSYALAEPGIRRLLRSRRDNTALKTHCSVVVTRHDTNFLRITGHLEAMGFTKILLTPATDLEGKTNGFRELDRDAVLESYDGLARDYEARALEGKPVAVSWFPMLMGRLLSGERKTHYCQGGRDYLGVAADGTVSLCYRFYENEEFAMGRVGEPIDGSVTERLAAHAMDSRTTCSTCWARYFCGGGCHHDNLLAGGGLGDPNPLTCDILRHSMDRTLEMWARLSRQGLLPRRQDHGNDHAGGARTAMTTTPPFNEADRPVKSPGCHIRDLGDERVVYEPRSHEVVVLNPTAVFIFERCDGNRSVADLLADLMACYDAPEDVLRRDLLETIEELRARGLLSWSSRPPEASGTPFDEQ